MNINQNESEASGGVATAVAPAQVKTAEADQRGYIRRSVHQLRAGSWPTLKYLAETEVHTYAFSVAACAVLSFVPAVVLMGTIIRLVFHSRPMLQIMLDPDGGILARYLPTVDHAGFILRTLKTMVYDQQSIKIMSLVMLLVSATGVFEPLEVALNKVWGFKANRNYLMNQVVSLGLAFGCSALALASVALTSNLQSKATTLLPGERTLAVRPAKRTAAHSRQQTVVAIPENPEQAQEQPKEQPQTLRGRLNKKISEAHKIVSAIMKWLIIKFCGLLTSISMFFLIYWLLPNGKVKPGDVFPAAAVTGVLLEVARFIYIKAALPLLDFDGAYGAFATSVTLIFWSFTAGLLLLGGAHLSAYGKTQD